MNVFERRESEVRAYCRVYPAVFSRAKNAEQFDENGRRWIDFVAGAGVLNFGHNHDAMKRALIEYISGDGVAHSLDLYTEAKRTFLERFEELILEPRNMDYRVQFCGPTGTNAVEAALKVARKATGRRQVVAFTDGFHGMTLGSLAATGNQKFRGAAGVPLENVIRVPFEGYPGSGPDGLAYLRAALADSSSGIEPPAAFLVEAIQAEGGVNVASAEWLQSLQALAREYGSLLIVDDIQAGMGRTGDFFSFEELGVEPDVVTLAKGIGGFGTPLALVLIKPRYDVWEPGEHTGTFRGQNLSFVAGTEALELFRDGRLLEETRRKGQHTGQRLARMVAGLGRQDMQIRGRGMIHGLDLGAGDVAAACVSTAFEKGLMISACGIGGRVLKVIPPLTIEDEVLDEGLDILEATLGEEAGR